ncbi:hypothetical protein ACFFGV_14305 [Pontibacillus salicampi]|uniref:Uncharacterized protein n=2 Tax=Pontibacillus salicampi TaxID=1449801 RepID=A0ABV6LQQ9_9BACI
MKPFHDINKHLGEKESWLQFPERKHQKFEKDFDQWHEDWHPDFDKAMNNIEKSMQELEKKMEE